jgi:hypothetical protein
MADEKTYDLDSIPEDAEMFINQPKEFEPLDPGEIYQVQVNKIELRDNMFYRPNEEDASKRGVKYNLSFEFVILDLEEKVFGRRIWDTTSLAFKPETKRGPTKLYKIVMAALKKNMDWDECAEFASSTRTFLENLQKEVMGKQLRVGIENKTNPDTKKTRSKVVTYSPIKKEMTKWEPRTETDGEKKNVEPPKETVETDDIPF